MPPEIKIAEGYETIDPKLLKPHPKNVKKHTPEQIEKLIFLIKKLGWFKDPLVIDKKNVVWIGNGRLQAALKLEMPLVPFIYLDHLKKDDRNMLMIGDNQVNESEWNKENTMEIVSEMPQYDWESTGIIIKEYSPPKEITDVPIPAKRETSIKPGDIFQLGDHRIMCGKCNNLDNRNQLLKETRPHIVLTDPPYSSGGFQEAGKSTGSIGTTAKPKTIHADNLSTRGHIALVTSAIEEIMADSLYIFTDWRMWTHTFDIAEICGYPVKNMIVWDKGYGGMGFPWRTQHELILFAKKTSSTFNPKANYESNVIQSDRTGNKNHPTEKPIDLLAKIIQNSEGTIVYDPFLGSGSTLMACEQTGRVCYGMEIDPQYIQIVIDRWEEYTKKKAKKL